VLSGYSVHWFLACSYLGRRGHRAGSGCHRAGSLHFHGSLLGSQFTQTLASRGQLKPQSSIWPSAVLSGIVFTGSFSSSPRMQWGPGRTGTCDLDRLSSFRSTSSRRPRDGGLVRWSVHSWLNPQQWVESAPANLFQGLLGLFSAPFTSLCGFSTHANAGEPRQAGRRASASKRQRPRAPEHSRAAAVALQGYGGVNRTPEQRCTFHRCVLKLACSIHCR
jgi:hypothetical protein